MAGGMQTTWTSTDIHMYLDLPPAFDQAGITWLADVSTQDTIAWTASASGWAALPHGVYDITARGGTIGQTYTNFRYAETRMRIIYGTALYVSNAGATWTPATQRLAESNTSVRVFVTNATILGFSQYSGSSPFDTGNSLASIYDTLQ
jgi:hypothetical protein